jgi:hypothetical protein
VERVPNTEFEASVAAFRENAAISRRKEINAALFRGAATPLLRLPSGRQGMAVPARRSLESIKNKQSFFSAKLLD